MSAPKPRASKVLTKYDDICTVVWTPAMGARLALARMAMLDDQIDFAARLGVGKSAIAAVEKGRLGSLSATLKALKFVLGHRIDFVLFGFKADQYPDAAIRRRFYDERWRGNRKNARHRENWEDRMEIFREKQRAKRAAKPIKKVMLADHLNGRD